ncbi:AAA family ATPase [Paenisporosarcina quisquiliarum]|uniref:AAA family ATPase n=1 Tax=Paenisporosarcina quisquiliarum TaxID=365346 RepID=A0A9X3LGG8_9BACL|nr:AAA family ATPase [Paenisporosarcina quisquiliarum]MCZ8537267.1 AAA family ATPase [Paenisporosarcina quisquiliarum]
MVTILSIPESTEWIALIKKMEDSELHVNWVANEMRLMEQLQSVQPCIVLLPYSSTYNVYDLSSLISQKYPLTSVLLAFPTEEDLDMKRVLRAGADDVLFVSSPLSKIKEDLYLATEKSASKWLQQTPINPPQNGKVFTVCSTKGGIGKTTVAVNLAVAYAKKMMKVAVVDLDLQFGDVAMFLDVKPKQSIYEWVKEDPEGEHIERYMTPYIDGLSVLAAPPRPEFAEVITGNDVKRAICQLKQEYDVVIIDVSSHMNENVLVALEHADEILVMTYLDLPTLKNSKLLIDTLVSLELGERVKVVLNRQSKEKGITTAMVEKVLGREIDAAIPVMDKAMLTAVNEGKPLCYSNPKSPVAKQIFRLTESLYNPDSETLINKKKSRLKERVGGRR